MDGLHRGLGLDPFPDRFARHQNFGRKAVGGALGRIEGSLPIVDPAFKARYR